MIDATAKFLNIREKKRKTLLDLRHKATSKPAKDTKLIEQTIKEGQRMAEFAKMKV